MLPSTFSESVFFFLWWSHYRTPRGNGHARSDYSCPRTVTDTGGLQVGVPIRIGEHGVESHTERILNVRKVGIKDTFFKKIKNITLFTSRWMDVDRNLVDKKHCTHDRCRPLLKGQRRHQWHRLKGEKTVSIPPLIPLQNQKRWESDRYKIKKWVMVKQFRLFYRVTVLFFLSDTLKTECRHFFLIFDGHSFGYMS